MPDPNDQRRQTAIAIAAHPDDIEFMMAGTLLLLREAGWEIHYLNLSSGNCGSVRLNAEETESQRQAEAGDAAAIEEQRAAAERRHEAEAAAAAMSLDEIVAAEESEAETADSDNGDLGDDGEATGGDNEGPTAETSLVDESADDVAGDADESIVDDEGKEG